MWGAMSFGFIPLTKENLKRWYFLWKIHPLEGKMPRKLVTWDGKNIIAVGRGAIVKSILTSQAIFHLTHLNIPPDCFDTMNKIERSSQWAGTREVSRGKYKLN
jgi:hypothetical protein